MVIGLLHYIGSYYHQMTLWNFFFIFYLPLLGGDLDVTLWNKRTLIEIIVFVIVGF